MSLASLAPLSFPGPPLTLIPPALQELCGQLCPGPWLALELARCASCWACIGSLVDQRRPRGPFQQVQAQAAALTVPVNQLTDEERAALAHELGYKSIGRELPDNVTLTDIIKTMPPEVRISARDR